VKRIALTGGIACGKSLLAKYLNDIGVETLDADDVVHELIPAEERRRLAKTVFSNPAERKALEARIHPIVRRRIDEFFASPGGSQSPATAHFRVAIIPLLFEVHWEKDYDIILCIASSREKQIERMVETRGYSPEEATARLAAQMPVAEKEAKSHYTIRNDGTAEELRVEAERLVSWLKAQR
jgi:dephospho-CoA kinase